MPVRDHIPENDRATETVTVPEWDDTKVVIRELGSGERNKYTLSGVDREEVAGGFAYVPKDDPNRQALLVVLSAYEEDGVTRAFGDDDVEWLASKSAKVVDRLAAVARRLSGLNSDAEVEAGKASDQTETSSSSTS